MPNRRDADALICAVVRFMATGEEPKLQGVANAMWIAVRPAVENSRTRAESGRRGGKQNDKQNAKQNDKQKAKQNDKQKAEKGESDIYSSSSSSSYSYSTSPSASTNVDPSGSDGGPFVPESADEVRAYFAANCLRGDPSEFFDHFESQGWVRSNGQPVADWRAQARMWSRRQVEFDQSKPADLRQPEKPLPKAQNAIDWEAELARLEGGA